MWRLGDDDSDAATSITSANIACGFHAGDPAGLARTCRAAADDGVRIGAQVSYRDLAGFGRRYIDVTAEDLTADVIYQIGALQGLAAAAGSTVRTSNPMARCTTRSSPTTRRRAPSPRRCTPSTRSSPVLGLTGSALFDAAQALGFALCRRGVRRPGVPARRTTGVAARTRRGDHRPRRRSRSGWRRWSPAARSPRSTGRRYAVHVESVCVHGDSPGAVAIATAVRRATDRRRRRAEGFHLAVGAPHIDDR